MNMINDVTIEFNCLQLGRKSIGKAYIITSSYVQLYTV